MNLKRRWDLDKNRACNKFIRKLINAKKSKVLEPFTKINEWVALLLAHCLLLTHRGQGVPTFSYSQGIHSNFCQKYELLEQCELFLLSKALITEK